MAATAYASLLPGLINLDAPHGVPLAWCDLQGGSAVLGIGCDVAGNSVVLLLNTEYHLAVREALRGDLYALIKSGQLGSVGAVRQCQ